MPEQAPKPGTASIASSAMNGASSGEYVASTAEAVAGPTPCSDETLRSAASHWPRSSAAMAARVAVSTALGELESTAFCVGRHLPRASFHLVVRLRSECESWPLARMDFGSSVRQNRSSPTRCFCVGVVPFFALTQLS